MNLYSYMFIVLALSFVSTFPYSAYSKEIPFRYTYTNDVNGKSVQGLGKQLLVCSGPLRRSKVKEISAGLDKKDIKFYSAEVTIFSPYGKWACCTYDTDGRVVADLGCPSETGEFLQTYAEFHLHKDDKKVDVVLFLGGLSIEKDSDELVEADDREVSAFATLGDDNKRPKRDRDTFTFNFGPNPGDKVVTVTLEEDPEAGHIGEEAVLILRNGNSDIELNAGMLPLEITAVLSADGEYKLVVEQHGIPEDLKFRGNYFLTVESDSGLIEEIKPSFDVEQ